MGKHINKDRGVSMKVSDIQNELGFKLLTNKIEDDREISGLYCSDLLSWVMANAKNGNVWVTVQIHNNILAVASLLDLSCIVIPENIVVEDSIVEKANEEGIAMFSTELATYDVFKKFYEAGLR